MSLTQQQIDENKQRFIDLFSTHVKREGADKIIDYLVNKSDFFTAPASTRFHGSFSEPSAFFPFKVMFFFRSIL